MEDRIVQRGCFEFCCGQLAFGRFLYSRVICDWFPTVIIILLEQNCSNTSALATGVDMNTELLLEIRL
jgi:hypothetical protein